MLENKVYVNLIVSTLDWNSREDKELAKVFDLHGLLTTLKNNNVVIFLSFDRKKLLFKIINNKFQIFFLDSLSIAYSSFYMAMILSGVCLHGVNRNKRPLCQRMVREITPRMQDF